MHFIEFISHLHLSVSVYGMGVKPVFLLCRAGKMGAWRGKASYPLWTIVFYPEIKQSWGTKNQNALFVLLFILPCILCSPLSHWVFLVGLTFWTIHYTQLFLPHPHVSTMQTFYPFCWHPLWEAVCLRWDWLKPAATLRGALLTQWNKVRKLY